MKKIWLLLIIGLFSYVNLALAAYDRNYIAVNYLGFPQSTAEIEADLKLLGPTFGYIRTYNSLFGPTSPENQVVPLVNAYNQANPGTPIKVAIGVALTPGDPTASQAELDQAILLAKTYPNAVNAVVVGNENIGPGAFTVQQLVDYMNYAKTQLGGTAVQVTTCQTWGVVFGNPDLVNAATSYVLANIYPYFDGPGYPAGDPVKAGALTLKNWQTQFLNAYNQLVTKYGAGKIRIGETGWPSGGMQVQLEGHWTGIPTQTDAYPNEQTFIEQYAVWASANNLFTYLFAAIDEGWKQEPGGVGPFWGLYTSSRMAKWTLGQLPAVNPGKTLYLGTDSPYGDLSFNGGTLLIVDPQTVWGNKFIISPGTTSTLDTGSNTLTHTGILTGNGKLIQTGSGRTNLQGDGSGFTGTYTLQSGTLNLSNTLGSVPAPCTVVINPAGTFTGTGTVVGNLTNNGMVNPGSSIGTLNVVGNYVQTANGTLILEVASPTSYDKLNVTGTTSLNATVVPVLMGGYIPSGNTAFPILTTTGGVSGTLTNDLNLQLTQTLFLRTRQNPNTVELVSTRDYTNRGLGLSPNQWQVGSMLDSVAGATAGDLNTVLNVIDFLPSADAVREAYKQISPEKAGALANLGFVAANFQVRNLATRTTNLRFVQGGSGGGASSLAPGGVRCNYSRLDGVMLAYNGGFLPDLFSARKEFKAPESRWGLFADGGAAFGTQNSTSNQTGYNFTLGGFTLGADYRLGDKLLVGLATGYSNTASGFYGTGGSVTVNTIPFNAYAAYFSDSLYAYGSLGYALNLYNLKRCINFDGIGRTATSSTTGNQFNLYGETGYDLKFRRFILTPAATLAYSALWLDGFTEANAGALNLEVAPQNASSVQTGVGCRVTVPLKIGSVVVVPQAYAFYQHEFANDSRGLNASLSKGSSTFTWQTDAAGQNYALVGASLTAGLRENLYAQVNFNAEVGRRNATAQYFNAGLRFEF